MKHDDDEEKPDENPVKIYVFPCGCKIMGKPPIVDTIMLCDRHRIPFDKMENYAPFSAKKILRWWDEKHHRYK
jgi:hypothetical protein